MARIEIRSLLIIVAILEILLVPGFLLELINNLVFFQLGNHFIVVVDFLASQLTADCGLDESLDHPVKFFK
jgi:hypothetical protein